MIITEIYNGQGLGNQLWCYVVTRVIALDRGYEFGIKSPEKFKCNDFLTLDFGKPVIGGTGPEGGPPDSLPEGITYYYKEKKVNHPAYHDCDIRLWDDKLIYIPDNSKVDGYMQNELYIEHHKDEIKQWLKIKPEHECFDYSDDNICVMNFRGGEYVGLRETFLPKEYWRSAMNHMRNINPNMKFVVITDDVHTAKSFFPELEVNHFSIGKDYSIIKNAKHLILSNSSFAWFPAWTNEVVKNVIGPKYWSKHPVSDGFWCLGYACTKGSGWMYQDREGNLQDYDTCMKEANAYIEAHKQFYI